MSGGTSRNGRLRTVVAGVAGAALLMTGCSSSDAGEENDPIAGTETAPAEPTEEADDEANGGDEAGSEPEDSIERPEIDLGDDFENVYEGEETGDPVKDAILRDSRGFVDAVDEGIIHHETDRPAVRFYIKGDALDQTVQLISTIIDRGNSSIGTTRYFNREVTVFEDGSSAAVLFCRDFSGVATIDFETREVTKQADADAKPALYASRVELNELGVWQTSEYSVTSEAPECR
ncbi:lipoprotein [Streptomyces calidiresistens]|uniref:Lipoprotein n=1 Tax=Streptomyces calidiresistens TaxID=1485586 RepID=A0A7W3T5Z6_9ACTN|nr:hypothetical protein [Streptomyces calidiresistens]MBB0231554.1 hypothetical protein [Streptomyces calidiresistens]